MAESFPEHVFNHDVVWLYDLVSRFHDELAKSQSAPVSGMITPDQTRLASCIANLRKAIAWIQDMPVLDMPETHPNPYQLEAFPQPVNVENEAINVLLRLIRGAAIELTNSQSARYSSGLQPFDEKRISDIITKMDNFLKNYIQTEAVPLDVPESSPEEPQITAGRQGV